MEKVTGDILDPEDLLHSMRGCDYVIHAAANTSIWPRRSEAVRSVNLDGTRNVMDIARKVGIQRMVHIGTANSFSPGPLEDPGDENSPFEGWKFGMDYIESKYLAQEMLLAAYRENGFPVIIINPTFMIGPYDTGPSSGRMLLELISGRLPGYSKGGRNLICSFDVARAAVNALSMGRVGECYIAGSENLPYGEFFKLACEVCEVDQKLIKFPHFLVMAAGLINSIVARISGKPPQLGFTMARMAAVDHYFSSQKAQDELKMPTTPIEVGIRESIKWFRENGYLI
jgi:dihydroflavonol-4-reductase